MRKSCSFCQVGNDGVESKQNEFTVDVGRGSLWSEGEKVVQEKSNGCCGTSEKVLVDVPVVWLCQPLYLLRNDIMHWQ